VAEDPGIAGLAGDRGYDSDEIRNILENGGKKPVIPGKRNRKAPPPLDQEAYRRRNEVERLVNRLKQFRRVATRYEKLGAHYLGLVQLCAAVVMLKSQFP